MRKLPEQRHWLPDHRTGYLRSRMRLSVIALMSLAIAFAGLSPATADPYTATDPEEGYTWLDIKAVRHRHVNRLCRRASDTVAATQGVTRWRDAAA